MGLSATAWIGLALLCGCDLVFGPGPGPGGANDAPGGNGDGPPPGIDARLIDANFPDAMTDGNPALDTDGDGVFDDADNCPTYNPDQRDHDGDLVGDHCDPCPHLHGADGADIDGDGDLIGEGCDPRPGLPGDAVVGFYGFYDSIEIAGWNQVPDSYWVVDGSTLRLDLTPPGALIELPVYETDVLIQMGVTPTGEPPGADVAHFVGISVGRQLLEQRHDCLAQKTTGQPGVLRYEGETVATGQLQDSTPWDGVLVGAQLRISALVHGTQAKCAVETLPTGPAALLDVGSPIGAHDGAIGIRAYQLAIAVDYLFVVRRGP